MTSRISRRVLIGLTATAALLAGCSSGDPMANPTTTTGGDDVATTVTVGSAGFPEAEILAELYAQALEADGVTVERNMQIGAREAYIAAINCRINFLLNFLNLGALFHANNIQALVIITIIPII